MRQLGDLSIGTVVYLKENNTPQPYIVVNQGIPGNSSLYDSSCNGTWLLRQKTYGDDKQWSDNKNNGFIGSINTTYLPSLLSIYDSDIQNIILTVKIPYCVGNGSRTIRSKSSGYSCKIFMLSAYELASANSQACAPEGSRLSYFLNRTPIIYNGNYKTNYWTRTPYVYNNYDSEIQYIDSSGQIQRNNYYEFYDICPAMIMPFGTFVDDSNNVTSTVYPVYPAPIIDNITVPSVAMQGQPILISWSSVSVSGYNVTYQLQRNVNNGGWQNVGSPISQTSYTDTAQSEWTSVQYQVTPVINNIEGEYTTSFVVPVVSAQTLIISGTDSNLGTLTSNIPYTVSSNTGNPISLTRTVNNAQVVTLTVESGFAYSIPVADLPTGTGTIVITASVQSGLETVTQTRTWTYYKTPINIPSTGGIAQLTQNGQNIWPVTVPDAVEAPVYLGGNLNAALNKLGQAALYTKSGQAKYSEITVDLSKVSVGDEVLLPYNNVMVPHIVVHIGNPDASMYDASCDGVWLLNKNGVSSGPWNSSPSNTLAGSTIMTTMQTYVANYGTEVQSVIKTVKIPYCVGGGNNTINKLSNGLTCKIFPLSAIETGNTSSAVDNMPLEGTQLQYFSSTQKSAINNFWTRSCDVSTTNYSFINLKNSGIAQSQQVQSNQYVYRPAFIMPTTFNQTYYVDSSNNIHPAQEYTQGGSITDVFGYDIPIAQSESGTYVGTGTYGVGNQTSISLSFTPKFICITNQTDSSKRAFLPYGGYGVCWTQSTITSSSISAYGLSTTWTQTGISWYNSSSAVQQMNESGDTYQYTVFG